jgi:Flagellar L-ring protein
MAKDRTKRRCFQLRLSSLFWLMLVVGAFLGGSRWPNIQPELQEWLRTKVRVGDTLEVEFTNLAFLPNTSPTYYRLAVKVVDILPDGSVVLQGAGAHTDSQHYEFSGIVQNESIRPDATVHSTHVSDLKLVIRVGPTSDLLPLLRDKSK